MKSRSSRRPVALSASAVEALKDRQAASMLGGGAGHLNLVFMNHEGRPLDPKYVDEHLKACCARAGVRPVS
ncbi:hypothetical protein ABTL88_18945, partial [Acinetobacter baumannii]